MLGCYNCLLNANRHPVSEGNPVEDSGKKRACTLESGHKLMAKQASLAAGIIGAVMAVLVCFGVAFAFSDQAGSTTGPKLLPATVQAEDA